MQEEQVYAAVEKVVETQVKKTLISIALQISSFEQNILFYNNYSS